MTLTLPDVLIGVSLLICVPVQLFLVQNWGNPESSRSYALQKFLNHVSRFQDDYLSWTAWMKWLIKTLDLGHLFPTVIIDSNPDEGESPAIEVMRYKHKHGYFSFSPEPRYTRPPSVTYRIGQVVAHKKWKYRGVIVGWDEVAKAPPEWLDQMHGKDNYKWRKMPNYSILVDTRDRLSPQLTYVPQVNIELITNTKIIHPLLDDHFESFDGAQYIPRPWLKSLYPQD
ncbi:f-box only protein 21 [Trichonephila clavata]|uniref:F-box only protein 21 n=1 Tax=Trichonephila clavata TaxID=2740835 RepID=A0A8X6G7S9_TRICU|nr:f-box only protein 21 [Trichonephila clavata]